MKPKIPYIFSLLILLIIIIIMSCKTRKAVRWVNTHPKPIYVSSNQLKITEYPRYTMIDSSLVVYYAGRLKLSLPDSIQ